MKKFILFYFFSIGIAQATTSPFLWIQSNQIAGFNESIKIASQHSKIPIYFPEFIPYSKTWPGYYSQFENYVGQVQGYNIDITIPNCYVVGCIFVSLNAQPGNGMQAYNKRQAPSITLPVVLQNGVEAQYTLGHAEADYWPPTLAWYQNGVTYILSWQGLKNNEKTTEAMITMASNLINFSINQANS